MKAHVKWIEDRNFLGESDTGHAVVMGSKGGKTGVAIAPDVDRALREAVARHDDPNVAFIPEGPYVVPVFAGE